MPEAFVEISIKVVDPDAQEDASITTNGAEYFATPEEITGDNVDAVKYAMLEPGLWPLDGTCYLVGGEWEPSGPVGKNTSLVGYGVIGTAILGKGAT